MSLGVLPTCTRSRNSSLLLQRFSRDRLAAHHARASEQSRRLSSALQICRKRARNQMCRRGWPGESACLLVYTHSSTLSQRNILLTASRATRANNYCEANQGGQQTPTADAIMVGLTWSPDCRGPGLTLLASSKISVSQSSSMPHSLRSSNQQHSGSP